MFVGHEIREEIRRGGRDLNGAGKQGNGIAVIAKQKGKLMGEGIQLEVERAQEEQWGG